MHPAYSVYMYFWIGTYYTHYIGVTSGFRPTLMYTVPLPEITPEDFTLVRAPFEIVTGMKEWSITRSRKIIPSFLWVKLTSLIWPPSLVWTWSSWIQPSWQGRTYTRPVNCGKDVRLRLSKHVKKQRTLQIIQGILLGGLTLMKHLLPGHSTS